ncbi:MAG: dihydropteroate synthase [Actinomycetes bacterium]
MTPQQEPARPGPVFAPDVTHVMAVVNLSPESRVRQAVVDSPQAALDRARWARDLGASIIDLGAQSSHFENRELTPAEELERLLPALELLVDDGFVVSVDSWKPEVSRVAVAHGAAIVNDTGGMQQAAMREVVRESGAWCVAMHIEGDNPLSVEMRELDGDRPAAVAEGLARLVRELAAEGIPRVIVDPGLSINYRSDYARYGQLQLETIRRMAELRATGAPTLLPVPRKAEDHRMHAYLVLSVEYGADVIRVHDVEAACDLVPLLGRRLGADSITR